jgi:hypothetical protein
MEKNILTFREWKNEFVKVNFDLNGKVIVTSFDIRIINTNDSQIVDDLKDKQKTLLDYYKKYFDSIQHKYRIVLDKSEIIL